MFRPAIKHSLSQPCRGGGVALNRFIAAAIYPSIGSRKTKGPVIASHIATIVKIIKSPHVLEKYPNFSNVICERITGMNTKKDNKRTISVTKKGLTKVNRKPTTKS